MHHVFISPHLDDVALSCGGYVFQLTQRGEQVTALTVCTQDCPAEQPLSAAAQHVHWEWQLGENPYQKRCAEDERACAVLGAQPVHLGLLDAVYRLDAQGQPLYQRDFIGVAVHPADWQQHAVQLSARLWHWLKSNQPQNAPQIYCPLAVGRHVDHSVVRQVVEALWPRERIVYYEDYPYADQPAALATELEKLPNKMALPIQLDETAIAARIDAIASYPSQMFALFEQAESMPQRVRAYIERAGGERYWRTS